MNDTYTLVLPYGSDLDVEPVQQEHPEITNIHYSRLVPTGQAFLINEGRIQQRMREVLGLYE